MMIGNSISINSHASGRPSGALSVNIVIEGDSLSINPGYPSGTVAGWPEQIVSLLTGADFTINNEATSGNFWGDLAVDEAAGEINAHYDATADHNIIIVMCGTNDVGGAVTTARTAWSNANSICASYAADGWTVILCTIPQYTGRRSEIFAYNNLLRTDAARTWDWLVDVGGLSVLDDTDQSVTANSTNYQADGIHLKDPAHLAIATAIASAVNSIISGNTQTAPTAYYPWHNDKLWSYYEFDNNYIDVDGGVDLAVDLTGRGHVLSGTGDPAVASDSDYGDTNTITFTGSERLVNASYGNPGDDGHLFVLGEITNGTTQYGVEISPGSSLNLGPQWIYAAGSGAWFMRAYSGGLQGASQVDAAPVNSGIFELMMDTASGTSVFRDGTSIGTDTYGASGQTYNKITLGQSAGGSLGLNGKINAVAHFNDVLSQAEHTAFTTYINARTGIDGGRTYA